jgi:hypothetical protein
MLQVREKIADEMALAATPVSFNLTGGIYMNQNAAFSDFHVTGGNPSGNASFTNPEYVTRRFTWVGHREAGEGLIFCARMKEYKFCGIKIIRWRVGDTRHGKKFN